MGKDVVSKVVSHNAKEIQKVRDDFGRLKRDVLGQGMKGIMLRISQIVVHMIRSRTVAGIDVDDKRFKGYSEATESERRRAGMPTKPVSLFFSGTMLRAVKYTILAVTRAEISVRGITAECSPIKRDKLAEYHQKGTDKTEKHAGLPSRKWFGLTKAQRRTVLREIRAELTDLMIRGLRHAVPSTDAISILKNRYKKTRIPYPPKFSHCGKPATDGGES